MKNKLTKIFISIFAIFSFVLVGFNLSPKAKASAYTASVSTYTISTVDNKLKVISGVSPNELDIGIELETLEDAFDSILEDAQINNFETIEIVFNNLTISTEEQITLSKNFIFSGSLTIQNTVPLFVCENPSTETYQSIVCDSLTLTNSNTTDSLNNFSFFSVSKDKTSFTLFNSHFNLTSTDTTHAIKFNSNENNISLKGNVSHNTTYLYNYTENTLLYVDEDDENGDDFYSDADGNPSTEEKIYISVPYSSNNKIISNKISSKNIKLFKLKNNDDFFDASMISNNETIYASIESSFTFNTNGGAFTVQNAAPTTFYYNYNGNFSYGFPDQTQIALENHHFIGWFGQLEYNSQTYYFDKLCLESYITNGSNPESIPTYFKTNLDTFTAENSFTKYSYPSRKTSEQYSDYYPVIIMAENGQAPEFIAKWSIDTYTVSFNTDCDTVIPTETYDYGSKITEPTIIPTKAGYTFNKWFKDENLTIPFNFETETLPARNITIYAGFNINSYTITFVTNTTETSIDPITYNYIEEIDAFEPLTKEGYNFIGWFLNEEFTIPFEYDIMPAENLTVYAKWEIKKIKVYFNTKGGTMINELFIDYGSYVEKPENPTKIGYVFNGWYYDYNCSNNKAVVWNAENKYQIKTQTTFYANWKAVLYNFVVYTYNSDNQIINSTYAYNATITLPTNLTKSNYIFDGWYSDESLTTPFTSTLMPAQDVRVYAKWKAKTAVIIDETVQKYIADAINPTFKLDNALQNFIIKYKVNGEWVVDAPTNVGTYDVMISRNEDDKYARFETIIAGGYVIEPIVANYTWLITILFAVFVLEIIVSIAVRILRKLKKNMVVLSAGLLIGNTIIPTNQITLIIISAVCVIAGFVVMCYQLVKLHRTLPIALITPEDENSSMEKHFKHSEKVLSEETHTYSAQDIEDMLKHDSIGHSIKQKHNLDELEKEEIKEKIPIAPVVYSEEHDNIQRVEDIDEELEDETPTQTNPNVEIVEDEYIANDRDDNERLYNSDDPFLRKDPTDYSSKK